mmetsp:Transcript_19102/g.45904  ORF Transcript_19102/g.45904 Transcript_19102/m.45904 type:complete len:285 (-) Transcript_19102:559-1413(-)
MMPLRRRRAPLAQRGRVEVPPRCLCLPPLSLRDHPLVYHSNFVRLLVTKFSDCIFHVCPCKLVPSHVSALKQTLLALQRRQQCRNLSGSECVGHRSLEHQEPLLDDNVDKKIPVGKRLEEAPIVHSILHLLENQPVPVLCSNILFECVKAVAHWSLEPSHQSRARPNQAFSGSNLFVLHKVLPHAQPLDHPAVLDTVHQQPQVSLLIRPVRPHQEHALGWPHLKPHPEPGNDGPSPYLSLRVLVEGAKRPDHANILPHQDRIPYKRLPMLPFILDGYPLPQPLL